MFCVSSYAAKLAADAAGDRENRPRLPLGLFARQHYLRECGLPGPARARLADACSAALQHGARHPRLARRTVAERSRTPEHFTSFYTGMAWIESHCG